jgi:hypothetical protein
MAITPNTVAKTLRDFEDRQTKLFSALDGEDDLGVVLRAHIYIEHELKEYIRELAPKPEHIKFSDYEVRTHLALGKDAPLGRAAQRSGAIVAIPILSGLHHHYVRT